MYPMGAGFRCDGCGTMEEGKPPMSIFGTDPNVLNAGDGDLCSDCANKVVEFIKTEVQ